MEILVTGVRNSKDYGLTVRSNMTKLLSCLMDSSVNDRAGQLLSLDIVQGCVATNYGCVDLVTRHGLLTWCQALVARASDVAIVRKVMTIAKQLADTAAKIDAGKDPVEGEEKRFLTKTVKVPLNILLSSIQRYAAHKNNLELQSDVESLSSKVSSWSIPVK